MTRSTEKYFYTKSEARNDFLLYDYDLRRLPSIDINNQRCYSRSVLVERFDKKYKHPGYDTKEALHLLKRNQGLQKSDSNKLVNKTTAKTEYFLPDSVLENIPHIVRKMSYTYSKLYDRAVLIQAMKKKYAVKDITVLITSLKMKREKRIDARKARAQQRQEERKSQLVQLLADKGLVLRDDSSLCHGFINGTVNDKTPEWIVQRMCEMKYLFEYCDMTSAFTEARNDYEYEFDFIELGKSLLDVAEEIALEKIGGSYPDKFPWLL